MSSALKRGRCGKTRMKQTRSPCRLGDTPVPVCLFQLLDTCVSSKENVNNTSHSQPNQFRHHHQPQYSDNLEVVGTRQQTALELRRRMCFCNIGDCETRAYSVHLMNLCMLADASLPCSQSGCSSPDHEPGRYDQRSCNYSKINMAIVDRPNSGTTCTRQ